MTALLVSKKPDKDYFNEIKELLGIQNRLNHLPSELSADKSKEWQLAGH